MALIRLESWMPLSKTRTLPIWNSFMA